MCTFEKFKAIIRAKGGVWGRSCVRFSRTQSEYSARYMPNDQKKSPEDEEIHLIAPCGLWSHRTAADMYQI